MRLKKKETGQKLIKKTFATGLLLQLCFFLVGHITCGSENKALLIPFVVKFAGKENFFFLKAKNRNEVQNVVKSASKKLITSIPYFRNKANENIGKILNSIEIGVEKKNETDDYDWMTKPILTSGNFGYLLLKSLTDDSPSKGEMKKEVEKLLDKIEDDSIIPTSDSILARSEEEFMSYFKSSTKEGENIKLFTNDYPKLWEGFQKREENTFESYIKDLCSQDAEKNKDKVEEAKSGNGEDRTNEGNHDNPNMSIWNSTGAKFLFYLMITGLSLIVLYIMERLLFARMRKVFLSGSTKKKEANDY